MKRGAVIVVCALAVGALALLTAGAARYGGMTGLVLRVRAEFGLQRPASVLVPTPLPTAAGAQAAPTSSPTPLPATRTATLVATLTESATILPTTAAPPTPAPTVAATPSPAPLPPLVVPGPSAQLTGLTHAWQTWNNCGPATLSMYLSYWGCLLNQEEIRRIVRPNPEDKHAGPQELADVAMAQGLKAVVRVNGSEDLLRSLVANGLPVMVSTWHEDKPNDGMGHYRLVVGYDDTAREWLLYDSLAATAADRNAPYQPLHLAYDAFAPWWKVFNHRYLVVYAEEQSAAVRAILAADLDDQTMWEGALQRAQADLATDDGNPFHWFNLGTDLVALNRYAEAAAAYDRARQLGLPWRMLWYQFGPFPAYYHVGRYDEVIALADATLAVTQHVEELHYWRAMALAAKGETSSARAALQRALKLRPGYPEAAQALQELGG